MEMYCFAKSHAQKCLCILRRDARMDVMFHSEEKNYTGFIMIDSFGSGTVFEKKKSSLAFKTRLLE